jgi:hypothetical protein
MVEKFQEGVITFDASAKQEILSCFGKTVDAGNFIVEMDDPSQRVVTPDGEDIKLEEFAGIKKGSEIYIKSDLPSLIELLDSFE